MIYRVEDGDFKDMATQHMLAPIFSGLKAEKALSKDDLFIINDTLYKATADIAQNAQIVVGTNADLASTVSEELGNRSIKQTSVVLGTKQDTISNLNNSSFALSDTIYRVYDEIQIGVSGSDGRQTQSFLFPTAKSYQSGYAINGFSITGGHFDSYFEYCIEGYFTNSGKTVNLYAHGNYTGNLKVYVVGIKYVLE